MCFVQMLYSKSISCNCDFSKFWCGLGEEFSVLSKRSFEVFIPFQNTYICEAVFFLVTIKRNIDLDWFLKMTFNHCSQYVIYCAHAHKTSTTISLSDWLVEIVCHFSTEEKFKHGCIYRPNVLPHDSVICPFVWNCFQNFSKLSKPLLKVFMLACKSILLKFHLRDW